MPPSFAGIRPTLRMYVGNAVVHPWHTVLVLEGILIGLAYRSMWIAMVAFAASEALVLAFTLCLPPFRRHVMKHAETLERARATERRTALLQRMSDEHRRELLHLEGVVDRIRALASPHAPAAQIAVDDCLHLLGMYVRVAIAHHSSRECLSSVDRSAIDGEIRALEVKTRLRGSRQADLACRRLAVARKRAARWDRSSEILEHVSQLLALIAELVHLTHEQVAAPSDPAERMHEVYRIVEELDENSATLAELSELFGVEESIEPRTLELGRPVRATET